MVIKLFGKEYEIPVINAKVALTLARLAKENPDQELSMISCRVPKLIYGEEVEDWLDSISIKQCSLF